MNRIVPMALVTLLLASLFAQTGASGQPEPVAPIIETAGNLTAVTVYPEFAAVTRSVELTLSPGTHRIRLTRLPSTIVADSARATVTTGAAVHAVHVEPRPDETGWTEEVEGMSQDVQGAFDEVARIEADLEVLKKREKLFDSVAERVAQEQADAVGGGNVDLDEISRVADYLAEQHAQILPERRRLEMALTEAQQSLERLEADAAALRERGPIMEMTGLVEIEVMTGEKTKDLELEFTYLVEGATWEPTYNLRAESVSYRTTLEFDGIVTQQTGEDWNDVKLTLSTAPAMVSSRPPALTPWYLEVYEDGEGSAKRPSAKKSVFDLSFGVSDQRDSTPDEIPIASYEALHPVSIPNATDDTPSHLVRLVTMRERTTLKHVGAPLVAEHAFLRGRLENSSVHPLPPGRVCIFFGHDYTGESMLPYIAPGGGVEIYYGVDPRVQIRREELSRRTRTTGLLGDGTETTLEYRITIDNQTGREINLELWDRIPASKDDRIKIAVTGLSDALSTNRIFRRKQRDEGLLRWDLRVEPSGGSGGGSRTIEYTVVVSHHRDVEPTDLPE